MYAKHQKFVNIFQVAIPPPEETVNWLAMVVKEVDLIVVEEMVDVIVVVEAVVVDVIVVVEAVEVDVIVEEVVDVTAEEVVVTNEMCFHLIWSI